MQRKLDPVSYNPEQKAKLILKRELWSRGTTYGDLAVMLTANAGPTPKRA